jgi:fructoselysine-6-P-deglycase FrlB-like protein
MADGRQGVNPEGFERDILAEPEALRRVAEAYGDEGLDRLVAGRRVLMTGMGSSKYAADTAVVRLRAARVDAFAELSSSGSPQPPGVDTAVLAISASGTSEETLRAADRHSGTSHVVAITNARESPLAAAADEVVDVLAGPEEGGIACRSFLCTQAVLALMCEVPADVLRRAADACEELIERRSEWLGPLADLAEGGMGLWVAGPAGRLGSVQQSALMLREAPRIVSDACETGDWLHVDVYLTKRLGYRLLLLAGSPYDGEVIGWRRERGFEVLAVGGNVDGATTSLRYAGDDDPAVAALAETTVAELLAAELWRRHPI